MSDSVEMAIGNIGHADIKKISDALRSSVLSRGRDFMFYVPSPLSNAKYQIKIGGTRGSKKWSGDLLLASVNVPACTVGNNVLIQNRVWSACQLILEMLRYQLRSLNLGSAIINKISMQNASITEVTLTYLFDFADHQEALCALNHLSLSGQVLRNLKVPPGQKKPVLRYGESEDFTAYFHDRMFLISAYVKSGPTPNGFSEFDNENIEGMIYAEGGKKLRVEIKMFAAMLDKHKNGHKYSSPYAWKKRSGADNPYRFGMEEIRKYFRLDERLRERRPKHQDLAGFSSLEQEILEEHFKGSDARLHPSVADNPKKFSALKLRILRTLRIDLTIPWLAQQQIRGYLSDTLTFSNRYRVTDALQKYSFCEKSVRTSLRKLLRLTSIQQSNRISDVEDLDLNIDFE